MHTSQPVSSRRFAVFDIDGTLIRWQLYHALVTELAAQGSLSPEAAQRINAARDSWKRRAHAQAFAEYEDILLHEYLSALTHIPVAAFNAAVDAIVDIYKDQAYTYTRDLIATLKADGYILLAISGSHQEILVKLASHFGFDHVVGSQYSVEDGRYTGEEFTPIHDKGEALRQLVDTHGLTYTDSVGVGDTASDISMLELVEQPIAFNPNRELFAHAKAHGWKIVVERKNMTYELEPHEHTYVLA